VALAAGARLGPYEIVGPLGVGGMGEVYRARDSKLKRQVALKVLPGELAGHPERRARLQHEAEVLAALKLDRATKRALEEPVQLAQVEISGNVQNIVAVTRDRVFFNTDEVRSNLWMTRLE